MNEICSCGSGRNRGDCCVTPWLPIRGGPLTPYALCKLAEDPKSGVVLQPERWTTAKVADMSTEALERQLAEYGVRHSTVRFRLLATNVNSAWEISEAWLTEDAVHCQGTDRDFLGLAACELWKRLLPGRPSMEQLDDTMQGGYTQLEQGAKTQACHLWWQLWRTMHPRFVPSMTTLEASRPVYQGVQSLFNWLQHFDRQLHNAAVAEVRWAEVGMRFCGEVLQQFPAEEESFLVHFRRALGDYLIKAGVPREGLAVFEGIVEQWPDNAWGYVALADAYAEGLPGIQADVVEARRYLDLALERAADLEDWGIINKRLKELEGSRILQL